MKPATSHHTITHSSPPIIPSASPSHVPPSSSGAAPVSTLTAPPFTPLTIQPGIGVGPFKIGTNIGSVLKYVQQHGQYLRTNELICSPTQPTMSGITLDLKDLGMRLRFDSHQQRLTLIDIYAHTRVPLVYMRSPLLSQPGAPSTFARLYHLFGPTYPGEFDSDMRMYMLQYPGVCMAFHLPTQPSDTNGDGGDAITLPDGSSPPLERLFVHSGSEVKQHAENLPPLQSTDTYFEPIVVNLSHGLFFCHRNASIGFDSYSQDLLSILGSPQNIYLKQADTDKMTIHRTPVLTPMQTTTTIQQAFTTTSNSNATPQQYGSPNISSARRLSNSSREMLPTSSSSSSLSSAALQPPPGTSDYFFNYFDLGMDVLLDGVTHRVKKFILHTNFIDRPDFNQYVKCNFIIHKDGHAASHSSAAVAASAAACMPSLLELPPTAIQSASSGRSMLHPNGIETSPPNSNSPSPAPNQDAPASAAAATSAPGGGKKKKKNSSTSASPIIDGGANKDALPPRPNQLGAPHTNPITFSPSLSPSVLPQSHATFIGPDSKWSDVLSVLGPCPSRPMLSAGHSHTHGGGSSTGGAYSHSHAHENPFGATYFYAYPGAVFEVCKNHHLASITLFRDQQ